MTAGSSAHLSASESIVNIENVSSKLQEEASGSKRPPLRTTALAKACWFVTVTVNGKPVEMLIDTGSSGTLISKDVFDGLKCGEVKLDSSNAVLSTANGGALTLYGKGAMDLCVQGHSFNHEVVVAGLGSDIEGIIGLDFMEAFNAVPDVIQGVLKFPNFDLFIHRENSGTCARVRVAETIAVPPDSSVYLKGCLDQRWTNVGQPVVIEPETDLISEKSLLMPNMAVKVEDGNVVMSVMNLSAEVIRLKKGTVLGSVEPVTCFGDSASSTCDGLVAMAGNKPVNVAQHLQPVLQRAVDTGNLSHEEEQKLASVLGTYEDIFVGPDGKLGQTNKVKHTIDTGDARPIKLPPQRLPVMQRDIATKEIDKMLAEGVVEESVSPWAAPIVLVKKKDGSTRFCVDYRHINMVTRKDAYPLPRIDTSLDSLGGAKWFCTLDLASGYWQVAMDEKDKCKTAFATHRGLYQFTVMPFGLCNAPVTFERLMELVLHGLQWEACLVYLDDVIVFGRTYEETLSNLCKVFDRLRDAHLKLKPKKCVLFQKEISFLGHLVTDTGIKCDPTKVEAIRNMEPPKDVSGVKAFLGLASYYRRFLSNLATISYPLTALTQKNAKFVWGPKQMAAFNKIKELLISSSVLAYPTRDDPFILDTDASAFGIGAVLSQVQNGEERPIAYASKTLSKQQQNYCTTYRELLAVVTFMKQFRHYLWGRKFTLRTDHHSLKWLCNFKEPEGMVARWLTVLDTYDFELQHRKGSLHGNADGLSRNMPRKRCKRDECEDCRSKEKGSITAIQDPLRQQLSNTVDGDTDDAEGSAATSNWMDSWTKDKLQEWQTQDPSISVIIKLKGEMKDRPEWQMVTEKSPTVKCLWTQWNQLEVREGILYHVTKDDKEKSLVQLVAPQEVRAIILHQLHNTRTAGHLGRNKTCSKVQQRFYWPNHNDDIARWCRHCTECAQHKPGPGKGRAPLGHVPVGAPMERLCIDLLGPLPETENGHKYIMVVGCCFTKWKEAYALVDMSAQSVADELVTQFICRFGVPREIHTDQGSQFESDMFAYLCELLQITKTRTTPYHPQSDGMIERFNRTVVQMLSIFVNDHRNDWDDHLPYVMMAYRASAHESTKCSPNLLMLGREIFLPIDIMAGIPPHTLEYECPVQYVQWVHDAMESAYELAREQLSASAQRQKSYYDQKLKVRSYDRGQWVWLWYPPMARGKFGHGWVGPYLVLNKMNEYVYRIQMAPNQDSRVVHVDHLKPFLSDEHPESWLNEEQISPSTDVQVGTDDLSGCELDERRAGEPESDGMNGELNSSDGEIGENDVMNDSRSDVMELDLSEDAGPRTPVRKSRRRVHPPAKYSPSL